MKPLMKKDVPDYKYTIAKLGYAEEDKTTVLELIYNYGVTEYSKGNAYAQVAIGTNDVYKSAEAVDLATKELGGKILRQPGPLPGINTKIASSVDPDGWNVVLVDHADFLKELQRRPGHPGSVGSR
ncbi:lactoylglutathione lyase-like isoform X3 [Miscanthus floridulus]|uniref:lactoylglutathione lyase-like isoform X3 n=1 Tax=Miscanthus floridulus TaxID=154761 RepID=UPI0034591E58